MEKSIKNTIVFVNIENNGKREIREARFTELYSHFDNILWCGSKLEANPTIYSLQYTYFKVEIAGIGVVSNHDLKRMRGVICTNETDACNQTNTIYDYCFADNLKLGWAKITLNDLNTKSSKFNLFDNPDYGVKKLYVRSWYYDGTRATCVVSHCKFQYDFINNRSVEFANLDSTLNKYTLYATREMCERANTPTIVRFELEPEQVEKIVTFEFTTSVKVNVNGMPECEEEDAITAAMEKIRTCSDEVFLDACVACTSRPTKKD